MKKHFVPLIIVASVILTFGGCGKSKAAQAIDTAIQEIGDVTSEKASLIEDIRNDCELLSEKEYAQLENLDILTSAETKLQKFEEKDEYYEKLTTAVQEADSEDISKYCELLIPLAEELEDDFILPFATQLLESLPTYCFNNTPIMKPEHVISYIFDADDIKETADSITFIYNFPNSDLCINTTANYCMYVIKYYEMSDVQDDPGNVHFDMENGHEMIVGSQCITETECYMIVRFDKDFYYK